MVLYPSNGFVIFLFVISNAIFCTAPTVQIQKGNSFSPTAKIKGITVVAPPSPLTSDPMLEIQQMNSDWICLVPYGFVRNGDQLGTKVHFNLPSQWWGEKKEGIEACIKLAHENGLKVMLKPQIYMHQLWIGDYSLKNEEQWLAWEQSYYEFISFYADLAIKHDVEMFCIGTELKKTLSSRESFWRAFIKDLRIKYKNKLVYSSNWDNYQQVPFWDDLDYVGISSYFPLTDKTNPTDNELAEAWKPIVKDLSTFAERQKKQILFTEYGYLSVDGCAGKTWELESRVRDLNINEPAQAQAFNALYKSLWNKDFWAGGFIWKWFPEMSGHEGYPERDYTPQNKVAAKEIEKWFSQDRDKPTNKTEKK